MQKTLTDKDFLLAKTVAGMSASIATRKWVPTRSAQTSRDAVINSDKIPEKVIWLTGESWPKEVQQFLVFARDGFDSWIIPLIILSNGQNPKGISYYGISLKKKKNFQKLETLL